MKKPALRPSCWLRMAVSAAHCGATALAGCWYLTTGLVSLALGGERALSGWTMGAAYGLGQLLVAGVLWSAAKETTDEG